MRSGKLKNQCSCQQVQAMRLTVYVALHVVPEQDTKMGVMYNSFSSSYSCLASIVAIMTNSLVTDSHAKSHCFCTGQQCLQA